MILPTRAYLICLRRSEPDLYRLIREKDRCKVRNITNLGRCHGKAKEKGMCSMHMNMYVRGTDRIREQYALEKTTRIAQAQGRFAQAQAEFDSAEGEIVTSGGQTL